MAVDNSSPEKSTAHLLPSSLLPVEAWCGIPVVTDTGVAVGVVLIASIVEDEPGGLVLSSYALTNAGKESNVR